MILTGGKVRNKVFYGEDPPRGPTPYTFIYHFLTVKVPLSSIFYWQMGTFYTQSMDLCIPFNCCKFTVFKVRINRKIRTFSQHFLGHKMHLLALFTDRNDRFYQTFIYSNYSDIPTLSGEPPRTG